MDMITEDVGDPMTDALLQTSDWKRASFEREDFPAKKNSFMLKQVTRS